MSDPPHPNPLPPRGEGSRGEGFDKSNPYIYIDKRACSRENGKRLPTGRMILYLILYLAFLLVFSSLTTIHYSLTTNSVGQPL